MRWLALCLVLPTLALAQDPKALFEEGAALYEQGAYLAAAQKFEASFAARPLPLTKYNIARCFEQAGRTLEAIDAWQSWLAMAPTAEDRPEAEASLRKLGKKLAKLGVQALTVTSLPVGAEVLVDGVPKGRAPLTLELPAGRHLLRLTQEGRLPQERSLSLSLDQPLAEAFELLPAAEPPPPPPMVRAALPTARPAVPTPSDVAFDAPVSADSVQVHIEADEPEVRLRRVNGNPNGECRTPCDVLVTRASDRFFIAGENVNMSETFVLIDHRKRGGVTLKVRAGNATAFVVGTVLGGTLGIAGLSAGIPFTISAPDEAGRIGGGIALGLGVTGVVVALVSIFTTRTLVTFE